MPAKYLTFQIDSASKTGTLTITGTFDVDFGFTLEHQSVGRSHFAAQGARLSKSNPDDEKPVFTVSIKDKVPKQRYHLKFDDSMTRRFDIAIEGSIELSELAVVEFLPAG
jgi:hypothetical protein